MAASITLLSVWGPHIKRIVRPTTLSTLKSIRSGRLWSHCRMRCGRSAERIMATLCGNRIVRKVAACVWPLSFIHLDGVIKWSPKIALESWVRACRGPYYKSSEFATVPNGMIEYHEPIETDQKIFRSVTRARPPKIFHHRCPHQCSPANGLSLTITEAWLTWSDSKNQLDKVRAGPDPDKLENRHDSMPRRQHIQNLISSRP